MVLFIQESTEVVATYDSLAKRNSVRESSFLLTKANYRKLQRLNENETKKYF